MLLSVEGKKVAPTEVVLPKVRHTKLRIGRGFNQDVIKRSTCSRHRDIIFFVNSPKITETTENTLERASGLSVKQRLHHRILTLLRLGRRTTLFELTTNLTSLSLRSGFFFFRIGFHYSSLIGARALCLQRRFLFADGFLQLDSLHACLLLTLTCRVQRLFCISVFFEEKSSLRRGDVERPLSRGELTFPRRQILLRLVEFAAHRCELILQASDESIQSSLFFVDSCLEICLFCFQNGHFFLNRRAFRRHFLLLFRVRGNFRVEFLHRRLHVFQLLSILGILQLEVGKVFHTLVEISLNLGQFVSNFALTALCSLQRVLVLGVFRALFFELLRERILVFLNLDQVGLRLFDE